jgi:D-galacturonate reductase
MFDLRRREKVNKLGMVGTNGSKFPAIRKHLKENIADVYADLDIRLDIFDAAAFLSHLVTSPMWNSFTSYPSEDQVNPEACGAHSLGGVPCRTDAHIDKTAIDELTPGDAVIIFTP